MDALHWVRAGAIASCVALLALAVRRRGLVLGAIRTFFSESQPAASLGVLRCFFFGIILINAVTSEASWYASLPLEFRRLLPGWEWAADFLPFSVPWTRAIERVLVASSLLATVGLFTRPASIVSSLTAIYVFGVPNFYFKIGHGLQVPVLSALVIAASPSGDGFSLDALYRRFRGHVAFPSSVAYALPIRFCWLLLGTMYLFPGVWKLWEAGDQWIDGSRLQATVLSKWVDRPEHRPSIRPDQWPLVLPTLGLGTLLLELGFFFALFQRKARLVAGVAAVSFHIGIALVTDIVFNPLHPLIVFVDAPYVLRLPVIGPLLGRLARAWSRVEAWLPRHRISRAPEPPQARRAPLISTVLGSALVLAMFAAGTLGINSWPVSVYPRFAQRTTRPRATGRTLAFMVVGRDGTEREVAPKFSHIQDSAALYGLAKQLRKQRRADGASGPVADLFARIVREECGPFSAGDRLRVYDYSFASDPALRDGKKRELRLIAETEL